MIVFRGRPAMYSKAATPGNLIFGNVVVPPALVRQPTVWPKDKEPPGPPIDLANMRRQGVRTLIAYCLNDACRHQALVEVWSYPANTEIAYFERRSRKKNSGPKCRFASVSFDLYDRGMHWRNPGAVRRPPGFIEPCACRPTGASCCAARCWRLARW